MTVGCSSRWSSAALWPRPVPTAAKLTMFFISYLQQHVWVSEWWRGEQPCCGCRAGWAGGHPPPPPPLRVASSKQYTAPTASSWPSPTATTTGADRRHRTSARVNRRELKGRFGNMWSPPRYGRSQTRETQSIQSPSSLPVPLPPPASPPPSPSRLPPTPIPVREVPSTRLITKGWWFCLRVSAALGVMVYIVLHGCHSKSPQGAERSTRSFLERQQMWRYWESVFCLFFSSSSFSFFFTALLAALLSLVIQSVVSHCLHRSSSSKSCFTSTETVRLIREGEPRTAASDFTRLLWALARLYRAGEVVFIETSTSRSWGLRSPYCSRNENPELDHWQSVLLWALEGSYTTQSLTPRSWGHADQRCWLS